MKKIYTLIIYIICFQFYATAQLPAINWTKSYGGSKIDAVNDVVETVDGGFLLVGFAYSNDGDVTGHHGTTDSSDAWLVKTNANGILQWQKSIGGTGNDYLIKTVATTDHGFVCIGETNSTNGDITTNTGGKKTWAIKIDRFGNLLWSQTYSLKISSSSFLGATDDNGFVFSENDTNNNLIKLNATGNIIWQKNFPKCQISLYDKETTSSCGIVLFANIGSAFTPNEISHYLTLDFNTGNILQQQALPQIDRTNNVIKYGNNFACISSALDSTQQNYLCSSNPGYPMPQIYYTTQVINGTSFHLQQPENIFYNCGNCGGKLSSRQYDNLQAIDESTILYDEGRSYQYSSPSDCGVFLDGGGYTTNSLSYNSYWGQWNENIYQYIGGQRLYFKKSKTLIIIGGSDNFAITRFGYWYKNTIYGSLFLDKNSNAKKDAGEGFITNFPVICNNTALSNSQQVYHNNNYFIFDVGTGSYTTKPIFTKKNYTVNPTSKASFFTGDGGRDTVNFALQPIPNKNDLQINAFALNTARPGFDIDYNIQYGNQGTTTLSGEVRFVKEHNLTYITANPLPSSISSDTLIWNYANFPMDSSATINVKFNIPNTFQFADIIHHTAIIYPVAGDETPYDNVTTISQEVRGSFDPNDKNEIHNGKYTLTDLGNKDALLYTIRFQNTGNDTAFTVEVNDTLDSKLDMNSFEMVSASHNYKLKIIDNKYCTWTFNSILLVDSNHNEPASHGYISYRIVPKTTVVHNDVINNSASIYFDFNLPVQTNVHKTTIINTALPVRLQSFNGKQNNKMVVLNWQVANEINMDKYIVEKSVDGSKYNTLGNINAINKDNSVYQFTDEQPSKSVNYYRLKMVETNGKYSYSNIVAIHYKNSSSITVYPNPTKDNLTIESKGVKKLVITDCFGRIVLQLNNISEHQTINTKQWNKGMYIVSFDNGEKVKVVKE